MSTLDYPHPEPPAADAAIELAPGLLWLRMPMQIDLDHINLYVLADGEPFWIVDTGLGGEFGRGFWQTHFSGILAGRQLRAVLCTHMHTDHIGQAGWLCREHGVPLHMSLGEYLSCRLYQGESKSPEEDDPMLAYYRRADIPDESFQLLLNRNGGPIMAEPLPRTFRRLIVGQQLEIGGRTWEVMVGSGHSPEHVCLYCANDGLLLAGDQVLPRITSNISVLPVDPEANPLLDWFQSLDRFGRLPADTLVMPAHGLPFRGIRQRLADIREHHLQRLEALYLACTGEQWLSAQQLLPALFRRELKPFEVLLAIGECVAHLNYLLAQGRLRRRRDNSGRDLYRAAA